MRQLRENFTEICIILMMLFSCTGKIVAQEQSEMEQYIQEFFIGETVFTQERKEFQVTLKPAFAGRRDLQQLSVPLELEYGISDRWQLSVEMPYLFSFAKELETKRGIGEAELSLMYALIKHNRLLSVSVGASVPFHTTSSDFKNDDEVVFESFARIGRQFERVQVHGYLAIEFTRTDMMLNYGLSAMINLGHLNATLEMTAAKEEQIYYQISPGLIWHHSEGFEFGLAVCKGLSAPGQWGVTGMLTWELFIARNRKMSRANG